MNFKTALPPWASEERQKGIADEDVPRTYLLPSFSNSPSSRVMKFERLNFTLLLTEMTGWYGNKGSLDHGS